MQVSTGHKYKLEYMSLYYDGKKSSFSPKSQSEIEF